jgi:hypothetical protein
VRALACVLLFLAACHDPVAGALVINDTDRVVTVSIVGSDDEPLVIEPGRDDFPQAPPGDVVLRFTAGEDTWERPVTLTTVDLALVAASPNGCIALSDHGQQYGQGSGELTIIAKAGPKQSGHIYLDGEFYFGVNDRLPTEIYPDDPVRRFTRVPCRLLQDERALKAHLWALD